MPVTAQPVITGISPASGAAGSNVTLRGTGFSAASQNNRVCWGSVEADVFAATDTAVQVTVPAGFNTLPVTVTTNGLTAFSSFSFITTIPGGGPINSNSFNSLYNFSAPGSGYLIRSADIDGDKKPDLLTVNNPGGAFSVYRNTASGNATGFAGAVNISTTRGIGVLAAGDLDGDGKPDIIAGDRTSGNIYVFKNLSTPGNILFGPGTAYSIPEKATAISVYDMDSDGKPDVVAAGASFVMTLRNSSSGGSLSLDAAMNTSGNNIIEIADLNGDLKPEWITKSGQNIVIVTNNSTPGNILYGASTSYTVSGSIVSVKAGVMDRDQKTDIIGCYTANSNTYLSVLKNSGTAGNIAFDATATIQTNGFTAADMVLGDLNGDGLRDITCSFWGRTAVAVYQNITTDSFSFNPRTDFEFVTEATQLELADFTCDGKLDLSILGSSNNRIGILRNNSGASQILSFSPQTGGEGTNITIRGRNLLNTSAVSFGGVAASSFTVIADTAILAIVGAGGASGNVQLTVPGGTISLPGFTFKQRPGIFSFSPASGKVGQRVRINGTNFSAAAADNVVYFGAAKATVTEATSSQLHVTVPAGATFQPLSVTVNGFTAMARMPFHVIFDNGIITDTSFIKKFNPAINYNGANNVSIVDLDGDGRNDLLVNVHGSILGGPREDSVGVYRNTTLRQRISFAPCQNFKSTGNFTRNVTFADIDSDGKSDVLAVNEAFPSNGSVNIFRNLTADSTIILAEPVVIASRGATDEISVADIDGDGKTDFVIADSYNELSVYRNASAGPAIAFDSPKRYTLQGTLGAGASWLGDLDGDGKPELLAASSLSDSFSVFLNTSTPGTIRFAPRMDIPVGHLSTFITLADMDRDGKQDVIIGSGYNRYYGVRDSLIIILRNLSTPGNILLAPPYYSVSCHPGNIAVGDWNGDGYPDLATASGGNRIVVFPNTSTQGNIALDSARQYLTGNSDNQGIASGDLDGDGKPDLAVTDDNSAVVSVFINQNASDLEFCREGSRILYAHLTGAAYQWQVNTGAGFINIEDGLQYTGASTESLTITNIPSAWTGYQYRCLTDGAAGKTILLKNTNRWTGNISTAWETPGNWSCGTVPDAYTDVIADKGTIVLNSTAEVRSFNLGAAFTITGTNTLTVTH